MSITTTKQICFQCKHPKDNKWITISLPINIIFKSYTNIFVTKEGQKYLTKEDILSLMCNGKCKDEVIKENNQYLETIKGSYNIEVSDHIINNLFTFNTERFWSPIYNRLIEEKQGIKIEDVEKIEDVMFVLDDLHKNGIPYEIMCDILFNSFSEDNKLNEHKIDKRKTNRLAADVLDIIAMYSIGCYTNNFWDARILIV